jgi:hypothetical protein
LPDDDLSHDGWTWGSGSGVWAESVDKVGIGQRGEIELPECAHHFILEVDRLTLESMSRTQPGIPSRR